MSHSERDGGPTEAVDIENVMQEVRQQILERRLPGQVQLPETLPGMPPEYYEHLYRAGLAQSNHHVPMLVTKSNVPLFGPLIDRLRAKMHELVVFYINRFAQNQAKVNNHILQAMSALGRAEGDDDVARPVAARGYGSDAGSKWATPDDLYACYRLLLNREPDAAGWEYWMSLVTTQPVLRAFLVDSFLNTPEFQEAQAERNRPALVELPDFKIYVRTNDAFIGAAIARSRMYEPHVSRVLSRYLSAGVTFVDVGANVGYFSLLAAARVGPGGRVIAFEPNPANCELLRLSMAVNGFEQRIDLRPVAVAEESGTVHFYTSGVDSNGRVFKPSDIAGLPTVEAVTLDEALADCDRVDVIKLDVEGAEGRVWRGMQAIVQRHRPTLVFEYSPDMLRQTSEIDPAAFLADVGTLYDLFIISPEGEVSREPEAVTAIIDQHAKTGRPHVEILARPRR